MTKKVCLVIGAGAGIGGSVGMKFAQEGYHAALCRRSDAEGLDSWSMTSRPREVRPRATL